MGLAIKAALGALVVLLIGILAKTKNYYIAGLIPLFPTFALIAHWIVASERSTADLRTTALFGICSLIPYAIYLLAVYWLSIRLPVTATLLFATLAWTASAGLLLLIWTRW